MNDALKILDKLLKKKGYAIKKHSEYNLLPLKNSQNNPSLKMTYEAFDKKENTNRSDNVSRLDVCLRTCINKKRSRHNYNELTGVAIEEHLLKCVQSLVISINEAVKKNKIIKLTVFDDRSDGVPLEKMNNLLNMLMCDWEIIKTENTGQGNSLYENFNFAREKNSLFYFVKMIICIYQRQ